MNPADLTNEEVATILTKTIEPPKIGDLFLKEGKRWRVTCTTADIYTLKCKKEERIMHLSELKLYRKHVPKM